MQFYGYGEQEYSSEQKCILDALEMIIVKFERISLFLKNTTFTLACQKMRPLEA